MPKKIVLKLKMPPFPFHFDIVLEMKIILCVRVSSLELQGLFICESQFSKVAKFVKRN